MIRLYNEDNTTLLEKLKEENYRCNIVYGDCIYDSLFLSWANQCYDLLKDGGIFYVQTDDSTQAEWKCRLDGLFGRKNWLNTLITIQEWGGTSNRFFPRKHDYIHMYSKGKNYKFYPERIQIPKITAGTNLDKKGTGLKTPCDVFYDLGNFPTTSKERIKSVDGKNIRWQKPIKLFERILRVCTDEGDEILDPFMGSGSLGVYCKQNNLNYTGIEKDSSTFKIAEKRIEMS